FEWCINKYEEPAVIDVDASDDLRVLRGGSWGFNPEFARSANRNRFGPGDQDFNVGFRVLCSGPF
ncbi:MAG: SUMF1/EgtB/PvdO family nonheme iron enzyme, partial [Candidatus Thiodiazotropha sp.]